MEPEPELEPKINNFDYATLEETPTFLRKNAQMILSEQSSGINITELFLLLDKGLLLNPDTNVL